MSLSGNKRQFFIALNDRRSKWALFAAIVVSAATFVAVVTNTIDHVRLGIESSFMYFTILSNMLSGMGAMFMLPYAVEGIRKKRFSMPKWVCNFQYAGAVSVFITMFCAATIIAPTQGVESAYGRTGFWLHLVIPIMAIGLFCTVESGHVLSVRDAVLAQIPFWTYSVVYTVMVVLVGADRGGWTDIYQATSIIPFPLVVLMLFVIGSATAALLRRIHNRSVEHDIQQLSAQWTEDTSPVELKIEAFGLGRYMAAHQDENEILIPMNVFRIMAQRYDVSLEELVQAYTKGVLDERAGL